MWVRGSRGSRHFSELSSQRTQKRVVLLSILGEGETTQVPELEKQILAKLFVDSFFAHAGGLPSILRGPFLFVSTGLTHGSSGMAACGCSIRLDPSYPRATSNFGVWPKARPLGVRTDGQRSRSSSAQFVQKDEGWRNLQCENERLQTPSKQRRQRESAGCRPSTETEMQKPRRHWSFLLSGWSPTTDGRRSIFKSSGPAWMHKVQKYVGLITVACMLMQ